MERRLESAPLAQPISFATRAIDAGSCWTQRVMYAQEVLLNAHRLLRDLHKQLRLVPGDADGLAAQQMIPLLADARVRVLGAIGPAVLGKAIRHAAMLDAAPVALLRSCSNGARTIYQVNGEDSEQTLTVVVCDSHRVLMPDADGRTVFAQPADDTARCEFGLDLGKSYDAPAVDATSAISDSDAAFARVANAALSESTPCLECHGSGTEPASADAVAKLERLLDDGDAAIRDATAAGFDLHERGGLAERATYGWSHHGWQAPVQDRMSRHSFGSLLAAARDALASKPKGNMCERAACPRVLPARSRIFVESEPTRRRFCSDSCMRLQHAADRGARA